MLGLSSLIDRVPRSDLVFGGC